MASVVDLLALYAYWAPFVIMFKMGVSILVIIAPRIFQIAFASVIGLQFLIVSYFDFKIV